MESIKIGVDRPRIPRCLNLHAKHRKKKDGGSPGHCNKTISAVGIANGVRKRKGNAKNWQKNLHSIAFFAFLFFGWVSIYGPGNDSDKKQTRGREHVTYLAALRI
jgi:hypothetical protein